MCCRAGACGGWIWCGMNHGQSPAAAAEFAAATTVDEKPRWWPMPADDWCPADDCRLMAAVWLFMPPFSTLLPVELRRDRVLCCCWFGVDCWC